VERGGPISYEVLDEGTAVFSSDEKRIGKVSHVLAAADQDIFDGLVITELARDHLPGRGEHRFVDAVDIDGIYEHAVMLKLAAAACQDLPQPSANPAVMRDDPADESSQMGSKLRRAWDRISGNY
jgi:hypothetical protein